MGRKRREDEESAIERLEAAMEAEAFERDQDEERKVRDARRELERERER